jgi:hypothetical protein
MERPVVDVVAKLGAWANNFRYILASRGSTNLIASLTHMTNIHQGGNNANRIA